MLAEISEGSASDVNAGHLSVRRQPSAGGAGLYAITRLSPLLCVHRSGLSCAPLGYYSLSHSGGRDKEEDGWKHMKSAIISSWATLAGGASASATLRRAGEGSRWFRFRAKGWSLPAALATAHATSVLNAQYFGCNCSNFRRCFGVHPNNAPDAKRAKAGLLLKFSQQLRIGVPAIEMSSVPLTRKKASCRNACTARAVDLNQLAGKNS
jgi:hypothetical protein